MKRSILIFAPIAILFFVIGIYFGMQRQTPASPEKAAVANLFAQSMPDSSGKGVRSRNGEGQTTDCKFLGNLVRPMR